jgi:hypothetical protein
MKAGYKVNGKINCRQKVASSSLHLHKISFYGPCSNNLHPFFIKLWILLKFCIHARNASAGASMEIGHNPRFEATLAECKSCLCSSKVGVSFAMPLNCRIAIGHGCLRVPRRRFDRRRQLILSLLSCPFYGHIYGQY